MPLSWLRDYVDVDLAPEQLAERLTLLGMEVKGIERWGADWRNVVVGELLTRREAPARRPPVADDRDARRRQRAARDRLRRDEHRAPASASRWRCPGAVLPGDRRIERTEKMGVVSNGMLCSGDELNLTADADGILILPPDDADRRGRSSTSTATSSSTSTSSRTAATRCRSSGSPARSRRSPGAPVRWPETDPAEAGDDVERPSSRRGPRPGARARGSSAAGSTA